jgi:opacity protein-like surface antigen
MSWLRLLALVGVLAAVDTPAMAADMPGNLPPPPPYTPHVIDANSGWYLRGDLGYAWGTTGSAQSAPGFASPTGNSLGNGFVAGIGAGIKSRWLRTDVTVDYTTSLKYKGTIVTPDDATAKVGAVTTLFNGYLDLGTWYHATPYVGGGAGVARLQTTDYASTVAPPFTGGLSNTQWKFAWAAMAGVGYAVSPHLVVDAGYRYMNFGDVMTASDASGAMTLKNLAAHEVRVGVRWSFDDLPVVH